jgi:hypothetical protein
MNPSDKYELWKFFEFIIQNHKTKKEDDQPKGNVVYLKVSDRPLEERVKFIESWYRYVKTQSTEDLQLWLDLEQAIQEYEICTIVLEELNQRSSPQNAPQS